MTGVLEALRGSLDADCLLEENPETLAEEGCGVGLTDMPTPRLVVDFDRPGSPLGPNDRRCDFLFVGKCPGCGGSFVVPIEVKGGRADPGDFVPQLQAGACVAERNIPRNAKIRFLPVLVAHAMKKGDRVNAKRDRGKRATRRRKGAGGDTVRFRNRRARVARIKCGDRLKAAFDVVRPIAA